MSIHFISGKPGGGKSMYAVRLLVQELRSTERDIVTNLPLKLGELAMYLEREYGETFNLGERVELLTENDIGQFWLHRGRGRRLEARCERELRGRKLSVVDYTAAAEWGGVFYAIDEVHIAFNSRKWMETGEDCIYYLSQHRKLGDDVLCITQHVNNVDKQFRSMAQDYTYLRNMSKERVGIFRSFPLFQRSTYLQPATALEKPMETAVMKIDVKGLGQVYDTAAGVGIHGRLADTTERSKGMSLAWLFAAIVVLFAGLAFVPSLMGKATRSVLGRATSGATNVARSTIQPIPAGNSATIEKPRKPGLPALDLVESSSSPAVKAVQSGREPIQTNVFVTGMVPSITVPGYTVYLSDGRHYRTIDGYITYLGKRHVMIGTNRIEWRN
jgi:hypothetical protein